MSMMANAPTSLSALINSVFEIARNYNLQEEHFYFSCLRSYQEMNDNYFDEIEDKGTLELKKGQIFGIAEGEYLHPKRPGVILSNSFLLLKKFFQPCLLSKEFIILNEYPQGKLFLDVTQNVLREQKLNQILV